MGATTLRRPSPRKPRAGGAASVQSAQVTQALLSSEWLLQRARSPPTPKKTALTRVPLRALSHFPFPWVQTVASCWTLL